MIDADVHKFTQNGNIMGLLLNTGNLQLRCVSYNPRYGTRMMIGAEDPLDSKGWSGQNLSGKSLMAARDILRSRVKIPNISVEAAKPFQDQLLGRKQWQNANNQGESVLGRNYMGSVPIRVLGDSDADIRLKDNAEKTLNVHKSDLTERMSTKYIFIPESLVHRHDSQTLIYSIFSPFCDRYPAEFIVNGQKYSCSLQYSEHHKALMFGDRNNAQKVLKITDLEEIELHEAEDANEKRLHKKKILCDAVLHKYRQNPKLKNLLLRTGNVHLGFNFPDVRYGIGNIFRNNRALDRNLWTGENRCGEALMRARDILKEETPEEILPEFYAEHDDTAPCADSDFANVTWGENLDKWELGQYIPVPEKYVHKEDKKNFLYDGKLSPFSDFYPAPFTVDGHTYRCTLQYAPHQKALLFGDQNTADKILKGTKFHMVRLKDKNFKIKKSKHCEEIIMICAAIHKFNQNDQLKELLLNTNDLYFRCMSQSLTYGTGRLINSDKALDMGMWVGENRSGKALVATRDLLRIGDIIFTEKTNSALYTFVKAYLVCKHGIIGDPLEELTTKTNYHYVTNNLKTHQQGLSEKCLPVCEKLVHKQLDRKQRSNAKKQGQALLETNDLGSETTQSSDVLPDDLEINDTEIELKHGAENALNGVPTSTISAKYIFLNEKCVHKKDSHTLVFGILGPFSNRYPAEFTVNGQTYICALQYTEHQKALLLGDDEKIRKILAATNPEEIELYKTNDANNEKLKQHEGKILCDAAVHKFRHIPKLKKLLLQTGDLSIGFATGDVRYGTGVKISSARALDTNLWV